MLFINVIKSNIINNMKNFKVKSIIIKLLYISYRIFVDKNIYSVRKKNMFYWVCCSYIYSLSYNNIWSSIFPK